MPTTLRPGSKCLLVEAYQGDVHHRKLPAIRVNLTSKIDARSDSFFQVRIGIRVLAMTDAAASASSNRMARLEARLCLGAIRTPPDRSKRARIAIRATEAKTRVRECGTAMGQPSKLRRERKEIEGRRTGAGRTVAVLRSTETKVLCG